MTDDNAEAPRAPALDGVRVLDFTRVLAGPWCSLNLADLGAEVIKVEHPETGDDSRGFMPPTVNRVATYFMFANRNKKSIALNIANPEGRRVVRALAEKVDILVENFRPGVMAKHGLDYAALEALNPRLIYCSISGYGHDSPLAEVAGYDPVAQAESGMMWVTGEPDGEPMRTGVSLADIFTGMFAVQGILGALHARDRDGRGQFIDIALLDSSVVINANLAQGYLATGEDPGRLGNRHSFLEPFGPVAAADGLITLVFGNQRQWERTCRAVIDRPDLLDDPRFATNDGRRAHPEETRALLAEIFRRDTRANWIAKFRAAGVPAGAVRSVGEALRSEEVRHRGLVQTVDHATAGPVEVLGSPVRLTGTPPVAPVAAPLLGEHTERILRDLIDCDDADIANLKKSGAIPHDD